MSSRRARSESRPPRRLSDIESSENSKNSSDDRSRASEREPQQAQPRPILKEPSASFRTLNIPEFRPTQAALPTPGRIMSDAPIVEPSAQVLPPHSTNDTYELRIGEDIAKNAFDTDEKLKDESNWKEWKQEVEDSLILLGYKKDRTLDEAHEIWLAGRIRSIIGKKPRALLTGVRKGTEMLAKLNSVYERTQIQRGVQAFTELNDMRYDYKPRSFGEKFFSLYQKIHITGFSVTPSVAGSIFLAKTGAVMPDWDRDARRRWTQGSQGVVELEKLITEFVEEAEHRTNALANLKGKGDLKTPPVARDPSKDPDKDSNKKKSDRKKKNDGAEDKKDGRGRKIRDLSTWYCRYCGKKGHDFKDCIARRKAMENGESGDPRYYVKDGVLVKKEVNHVNKGSNTLVLQNPASFIVGTSAASDWYRSYAETINRKKAAKGPQYHSFSGSDETGERVKPRQNWWIFDTGADIHATNEMKDYIWYDKLPQDAPPIMTGGGPMRPTAIGDVRVKFSVDGNPKEVLLFNTLFFETFPVKVFSGEIFLAKGGKVSEMNKEGVVYLSSTYDDRIAYLNLRKSGCFIHEHGYKAPQKLHNHASFLQADVAECQPLAVTTVDIDKKQDTSDNNGKVHPIQAVDEPEVAPQAPVVALTKKEMTDMRRTRLWHRRLGHPNVEALKKTLKMVKGVDITPENVKERPCDVCDLTKSLRYRSQRRIPRATKALETLHMDSFVIKPVTIDGYTEGVYIIDDYSRYRWVFFGKGKADLANRIIELLRALPKKVGKPIATIHSDQGREFLKVFKYAKKKGIQVTESAPYTPEENPVAERTVGIVNTKASALMRQGEIPQFLSSYAVAHAVLLANCTQTSALSGKTPYEAFRDEFVEGDNRPDIGSLRTLGCTVFVNITRHPQNSNLGKRKGRKWDPKAARGILVGQELHSHNYYVYFPGHRKVLKSPHVVFHEEYSDEADDEDLPPDIRSLEKERSFPPWVDDLHGRARPADPPKQDLLREVGSIVSDESDGSEPVEDDPAANQLNEVGNHFEDSDSGSGICEIYDADCSRVAPTVSHPSPGAQLRGCMEDDELSRHGNDGSDENLEKLSFDESTALETRGCDTAYSSLENEHDPPLEFIDDAEIYSTVTAYDPKTVKEALSTPHAKEWREAMFAEIRQHLRRGTFRFVCGNFRHKLTCKWVFKEKRNVVTGEVFKRKARIVARGFQQRKGIDYNETFASTAISTSARILLALAAREKLAMRCADVVGAYLMGEALKEIIHAAQFAGLEEYFDAFPEEAVEYGYSRQADLLVVLPLYGLKQSGRNWQQKLKKEMREVGMIPLLKDDAVYTNADNSVVCLSHVDDLYYVGEDHAIQKSIEALSERVTLEEGDASCYLGMHITKHEDGSISIDQSAHIDYMVGNDPMRPSGIPVSPSALHHAAVADEKAPAERIHEFQKLVGQIIYPATRTRPDLAFASALWARYMHNPSADQLRELKKVLKYLNKRRNLGIFYEGGGGGITGFVDAAFDNQEGSKSTTGWIFMMNGGPVSWASKRQSVVALSSAEAEYYALGSITREASWMREFMEEIGRPINGPLIIKEDNTACIKLAKNTTNSNAARTKHINRHKHFVRDEIKSGNIAMEWVPSADQLADGLTKPLEKQAFDRFVGQLGMREVERKE